MDGGEGVGPAALRPERVLVVGAGPAGCLVSRRLADSGHEVTLLEAGPGAPMPASIVGPDWFDALAEPGWTWPDVPVTRIEGQQARHYVRGRGLGGSSSVNAMIAMAGPEDDIALIANRRAQAQVMDDIVTERPVFGPLASALAGRVPVRHASLLRKDRQRQSGYDLYLAGREDSLEVRTNAEVARLLVTSGRRVCGVELADGETLLADRVVVCAGAIHSPALLLRSGVVNPQIGVGLKDHPAVPFTLSLHRAGPVGEAASTAYLTWSSKVSGATDDLQVMVLEHLGAANGGAMFGQLMVALMAVESSGSVTVDSNGDPVVNFNMLSERADRVRLRYGVRRVIELLETDVFADVVASVAVDEHGFGLDSVPLGASLFPDGGADDMLDDWMREHLGAYVHAGCSCAVGGAVGNAGVVRGWQGVSVIDASALPIMPRANTQLPTLMLAETLAGQLLVLINSQA